MEGFADEAANQLNQILLLVSSGHRNRDVLRRLKQYKDFIANPSVASTDFAQMYKERIEAAFANTHQLGTYVCGAAIAGDALRKFSDTPVISGPLVCQLCDTDFINEKAFSMHKKTVHVGES